MLPLFGVKQPGPQPRRKHCLDPSKHCRVCTPFKLKHTTVAYAYYCSICTALQREHSIAENAHHPHICVLWSIICIPSLIGFQDVCPSMCLWQCCHLGWLWGWMRRQVGMGLGLAMGSAEWQWCCRGAKLHRGLAAWRDAHPWHGGMHTLGMEGCTSWCPAPCPVHLHTSTAIACSGLTPAPTLTHSETERKEPAIWEQEGEEGGQAARSSGCNQGKARTLIGA